MLQQHHWPSFSRVRACRTKKFSPYRSILRMTTCPTHNRYTFAWKYAYENYLQMSSDGLSRKKPVVLSIYDANLIKIWWTSFVQLFYHFPSFHRPKENNYISVIQFYIISYYILIFSTKKKKKIDRKKSLKVIIITFLVLWRIV